MKSPEQKERAPEYTIREATPTDAAAIARIQYDAWIATYPNKEEGITGDDVVVYLGDIKKREEKWEKTMKELPASFRVFIAEEAGKVIGFCKVEKKEDEHHLDALYLDLATTGRGIGGSLMNKAFAYLGEDKPMVLEVATQNEHAKSIYKHYGFKEAGEMIFPKPINGKIMHLTIMRRPAKT